MLCFVCQVVSPPRKQPKPVQTRPKSHTSAKNNVIDLTLLSDNEEESATPNVARTVPLPPIPAAATAVTSTPVRPTEPAIDPSNETVDKVSTTLSKHSHETYK